MEIRTGTLFIHLPSMENYKHATHCTSISMIYFIFDELKGFVILSLNHECSNFLVRDAQYTNNVRSDGK